MASVEVPTKAILLALLFGLIGRPNTRRAGAERAKNASPEADLLFL